MCVIVGVKELYDSFKSSSARLLGTDQSFLSLRSDLTALAQFKGAWTIFLNLNPSDMHSSLMFELSGHKYVIDTADIEGPPIGRPASQEVRQVVAKNPVAAANFFWTYLHCFVSVFLGWNMLSRTKVGRGNLGDVDAYYMKFETGKRGVIHAHSQAMQPAMEANRLRDHLTNTSFRPVLLLFLEQVMCMYIPTPFHDGYLPDWAKAADGSLTEVADIEHLVRSNKAEGKPHTATVCEAHLLTPGRPSPKPVDIDKAVIRIAHEIQTHTHTPTCDSSKRGALVRVGHDIITISDVVFIRVRERLLYVTCTI